MPVALNGDPAPPGGNFSFKGTRPDLHVNNSGDLVFRAALTDGPSDSGLFLIRREDGILRTIAFQGQAAPGMGGSFETLAATANQIPGEPLTLTPAGEVWTSQYVLVGGENIYSYFRFRHNNKLEKVFARGDPAPGNWGGILAHTIQVMPLSVSAAGDYYFYAGIAGGSIFDAIFVTK